MTADGRHLPDALIDVTLSRLEVAKGDDLGIVIFGDRGHGKSIVWTSRPTWSVLDWCMVDLRVVADLWATGRGVSFGKRTRETLGGSLPIGSHDV